MTLILFAVQVLRGSGSRPSVIGSTQCSKTDWSLLVLLLIAAVCFTVAAIKIQRSEHAHKEKIGYIFVAGDNKMTPTVLVEMVIRTFAAGFANAVAGCGPGVMMTNILLKMEYHP